jgi:tryptophan synthase alpha chain
VSAVRAQQGADRIEAAFASHGKRAALMPYLMGGYPSIEVSRAAGEAAIDAGADLIELGIPFSDPLADGPVIHAAGTEALAAGVTPTDVLGVCEALAARVPVALMVYANVVLVDGAESFARRAAAAGAAGLIVPDVPQDEAAAIRAACDAAGLALIPLVTGERAELPPELPRLVERVRAATSVPVAVGFGISTAEQAGAVGELADGVIVGSRIVRAAGEGGAQAVGAAVADLAGGLSVR